MQKKKPLDIGVSLLHSRVMAVYTPVSEQELQDFLSLFEIGTLQSCTGIEAGVSNTNYFVTTDRDRFVLTLFEPHRVHEGDIPFYLDYAITLEKAGVPCPRTISAKDGSSLSRLCGRPAAIFSVLSGEEGHVSKLTPAMCESAGSVLARMHLAAGKITEHAQNHFGRARWDLWVATIGSRMDRISSGLYALVKGELLRIENELPSNLPSGAIHGDYFPDNVFFQNNEVTGVIDFHFVCTDAFVYDLAIAINAWSFDQNNAFQQERMDAIVRGYDSVRPLSQAESKALPVLLRAAALRFLLSRIEEKLNWKPTDFMKPHDPMVFEKRLRHFGGGAA